MHDNSNSPRDTPTISSETQVNERPSDGNDVWKTPVLLFGLTLAMFMVSLNSTVVAPAMSIIATELDALDDQTWIATAFLVALNAFQPLTGKFSDIFGRKPIILFALSFFLLGSLINALSPTIQGLIGGRTIQGFGAGGITSILFVIMTDIAPLDWRPRLQSLLVVVYGLASVVGPLIGGAFVDDVTWRWDFWLNIILAGLSLAIIGYLFRDSSEVVNRNQTVFEKIKRIDILGTVFSVGFVCCLLLALNWGPLYGWNSAYSIGPFVAAGVSLILLLISEGWVAKEPLIPPKLMLNPNVFPFFVYMALLGIGFMGTLYYSPILFQSVFGANSTESGVRLIPYMVCLIAGSVGSSIGMRKFPYPKLYIVMGAASNLIGFGLFYTVNEHSNWGQQAGFLTFCGLAMGLSQQNCIMGVQVAAGKEFMAVATSLANFFMMLTSSIGIAIYQTLYSIFLQDQLTNGSVPDDILTVASKYGALSNYLYIRNMPADTQGPIIHAYMQALHKVFILPLAASAASLVVAVLIRNVRFGAPLQRSEEEVQPINEKVEQQSKS